MGTCAICKGQLEKTKTKHVIAIGDARVTVEVPAMACHGCDERFVDGLDLERAELSAALAIIASGRRSGPAFRFLRKVIGMPAKDLAVLFDVAPETLSRWECGEREVTGLAWAALAQLVREHLAGRHDMREILEALRKPTPLPAVVPALASVPVPA